MCREKCLFFNLEKLEALELEDYIPALKTLHYGLLPSRKNAKRYGNLHGNSFILKPCKLLNDKTTDILYIIQYIKLAGRRNYALYKTHSLKYLDLSYYPEINVNNINHNPLLYIANNKIYFKYEEL